MVVNSTHLPIFPDLCSFGPLHLVTPAALVDLPDFYALTADSACSASLFRKYLLVAQDFLLNIVHGSFFVRFGKMASHDQQLPHDGPGQAVLMSSGSKKRAKVSSGSRVQDSRGFGGQAGKATGTGLRWLRFSWPLCLCTMLLVAVLEIWHTLTPELQYSKPPQSRAVLELLATLQGKLQSS